MKVRWSSTYVMLYCAHSRWQVSLIVSFLSLFSWLQQQVDEFIYGLGLKEGHVDKWRKISALVLSEEEWTRIHLFCNVLQVCDLLTMT